MIKNSAPVLPPRAASRKNLPVSNIDNSILVWAQSIELKYIFYFYSKVSEILAMPTKFSETND